MIHNITDKERDLSKLLQNATQRINDLEAEVFEQARLLGMSGEREAALLANIARQEKALKLALDALEIYGAQAPAVHQTIAAIREALTEHPAQQQEPVAVVSGYYGGQCVITYKKEKNT